MKIGEFVLVHLVNPKEKFWGILRERDSSGVTVARSQMTLAAGAGEWPSLRT